MNRKRGILYVALKVFLCTFVNHGYIIVSLVNRMILPWHCHEWNLTNRCACLFFCCFFFRLLHHVYIVVPQCFTCAVCLVSLLCLCHSRYLPRKRQKSKDETRLLKFCRNLVLNSSMHVFPQDLSR